MCFGTGANYWELLGEQRICSIENLFAGPDLSQKPHLAAAQALEEALLASKQRQPSGHPETPLALDSPQTRKHSPAARGANGSGSLQGAHDPDALRANDSGGGEASEVGAGLGALEDGSGENARFTLDMIAAEAARQRSEEVAKYGIRRWGERRRQIEMNGAVVKVEGDGSVEVGNRNSDRSE